MHVALDMVVVIEDISESCDRTMSGTVVTVYVAVVIAV